MCIRDRPKFAPSAAHAERAARAYKDINLLGFRLLRPGGLPVSYTHLRAHETVLDLVCRLLLEKKTH